MVQAHVEKTASTTSIWCPSRPEYPSFASPTGPEPSETWRVSQCDAAANSAIWERQKRIRSEPAKSACCRARRACRNSHQCEPNRSHSFRTRTSWPCADHPTVNGLGQDSQYQDARSHRVLDRGSRRSSVEVAGETSNEMW